MLAFLAAVASVPASAPATMPADPGAAVDLLQTLWREGQWPAFAAVGINLLVWLLNFVCQKFGAMIPKKYLPWLSGGAGVLAAVAVELSSAAPGASFGLLLVQGLMVGFAASGLWSAASKHFLPSGEKKAEVKAPEAEAPAKPETKVKAPKKKS
jgi:alkylation response protein AidB-like acyl-CoA dehydrogenase